MALLWSGPSQGKALGANQAVHGTLAKIWSPEVKVWVGLIHPLKQAGRGSRSTCCLRRELGAVDQDQVVQVYWSPWEVKCFFVRAHSLTCSFTHPNNIGWACTTYSSLIWTLPGTEDTTGDETLCTLMDFLSGRCVIFACAHMCEDKDIEMGRYRLPIPFLGWREAGTPKKLEGKWGSSSQLPIQKWIENSHSFPIFQQPGPNVLSPLWQWLRNNQKLFKNAVPAEIWGRWYTSCLRSDSKQTVAPGWSGSHFSYTTSGFLPIPLPWIFRDLIRRSSIPFSVPIEELVSDVCHQEWVLAEGDTLNKWSWHS